MLPALRLCLHLHAVDEQAGTEGDDFFARLKPASHQYRAADDLRGLQFAEVDLALVVDDKDRRVTGVSAGGDE